MSNCDKCENYNQEKHYCPTYCEVIRNSCEEDKQWYLDRLQAMCEEIENNMEEVQGIYNASTPEHDRPLQKIARNEARKECLAIIDKYMNK